MKTWQLEMGFVALCLGVVLVGTEGCTKPVEWIGSLAVLFTFCHAQVADRLAEQAAAIEEQGEASVTCHRWAARYWVTKELLWLAYFTWLGAYAALVGVGVFLAYPAWRGWYRARVPTMSPRKKG